MDILALAHEIILVPGLRFVDTFARGSCYSFFFRASFSSMHPHPVFISESDIWSLPRFSMDFGRAQPPHFSSPSFPLFPLSLPRESTLSVFPTEHGESFFYSFRFNETTAKGGEEDRG